MIFPHSKTEVFMAQEDTFKITYATLSAPSEEMHLEYDRAIEKVRKGILRPAVPPRAKPDCIGVVL